MRGLQSLRTPIREIEQPSQIRQRPEVVRIGRQHRAQHGLGLGVPLQTDQGDGTLDGGPQRIVVRHHKPFVPLWFLKYAARSSYAPPSLANNATERAASNHGPVEGRTSFSAASKSGIPISRTSPQRTASISAFSVAVSHR